MLITESWRGGGGEGGGEAGEGAGSAGGGADGSGGSEGGGAMQLVVVPETPVRAVAQVHSDPLAVCTLAPSRVAVLLWTTQFAIVIVAPEFRTPPPIPLLHDPS